MSRGKRKGKLSGTAARRMRDAAYIDRQIRDAEAVTAATDITEYPGPGQKNAYVCLTCHHVMVTGHVDHGVTPANVMCRQPGCNGRARSTFYTGVDETMPVEGVWYRPDAQELKRLDVHTRMHVAQGGLLLRPTPSKESTDAS